jgi:hypothetical protein
VRVPTNKIPFRDAGIFDFTGADPYPGDVLVENDRMTGDT